MILKKITYIIALLFFTITCNAKPFTVVIDPGHGGYDPGAIGKKGREKDITLAVSLLVGKQLAKLPDVKVIYTRKTDKHVNLKERPKLANKNKADLFISIHVNSAENSSAYGAETFFLRTGKEEGNLEVAKRENAVILLEDNHTENYQGFDPNSPDSYIMFELIQDKNINQSRELATYVQNNFKQNNRHDREVRQAGFWVLYQCTMPSILIELGFISNAKEEKYLLSKAGQKAYANAIVKAFNSYKHSYDIKTTDTSSKTVFKTDNKTTQTNNQSEIVYRIQVFTIKDKINKRPLEAKRVNQFKPVRYTQTSNGYYKYTCCEATTYTEIKKQLSKVRKLYKDAYIVAFKKGKKINVKDAIKITH